MIDEIDTENLMDLDPVSNDPFLSNLSQISGGVIGDAAQSIVFSAQGATGGPAVDLEDRNNDGVFDAASVDTDFDGIPDVTFRDLDLNGTPDVVLVGQQSQSLEICEGGMMTEEQHSDGAATLGGKRDDLLDEIKDAKADIAYQERRVADLTRDQAEGWIVDSSLWYAKSALESAQKKLHDLEYELSYVKD